MEYRKHSSDRGRIEKYAGSIVVRTYDSGERRIVAPPRHILIEAFDELGTHKATAAAFGVSRGAVATWLAHYGVQVESKPEVATAYRIGKLLAKDEDKIALAQWITDEGSLTVGYFLRNNLTSLIVCGSMNDFDVLKRMSAILSVSITCSKSPSETILPMGGLRVQSATAYALLSVIVDKMVGLKAKEARAALGFFPPSGTLRGRHTTDEFLVPVWREFAEGTLREWNSHRRTKLTTDEIGRLAETWVEGRIRRARRFVDALQNSRLDSFEG